MISSFLWIYILAGILIGGLITVVLIMLSRTDHSLKGEYDERQMLMKGKAFRSGFFTSLGYGLIVYFLDLAGISIPMDTGVVILLGVVISLVVYVSHAIMVDAYIGLNENVGRTIAVFAVVAFLNIIPIVGFYRTGNLVVDGRLTNGFANVIVLSMIVIISVVLLIKHCLDGGKEESDEES